MVEFKTNALHENFDAPIVPLWDAQGAWARSDILATVFTRAFRANFSLSFPTKRL